MFSASGKGAVLVACCVGFALIALAQSRGRVSARYEAEMQDPVDDPPDTGRKAEFALGRLRYRSPMDGFRGRYHRWGIDANKGDRLFVSVLNRLTRIDAEPVETIVDVESDTMFDHPFLLAISVGDWQLSTGHAARLREYLHRGGFLMVDDFHNEGEWANFMAGIRQIDPTLQAIELDDDSPPFHTVFNLKERVRVVGANVVHGSGIERGGVTPHWRGIHDSSGRMMVGICFNMDVGDGLEFADSPEYPERMSSAAIQLTTNYAVYAMSH